MSRIVKAALNLASVGLIVAGAALAATIFFPQFWSSSSPGGGSSQASASQTPTGKASKDEKDHGPEPAPSAPAAQEPSRNADPSGGPQDKTLDISIPAMNRVKDDSVPSTVGDDERALKQNVAIHLKGTGYPWQREANVYLAGHRIGYPGTDSFLGFYDLNALERGDKIYVTDSAGEHYTYRVYRERVVKPANTAVTEPVEGKNILTLQTCTLPNYTQRLVVLAEKIA